MWYHEFKYMMHTLSAKIIFSVVLIAFAGFSLFGLAATLVAMQNGMANCFLANDMAVCNMGINQHINIWNTIFNSLLPTLITLGLFLFAALLLLFLPVHAFGNASLLLQSLDLRGFLYRRENPHGSIFNSFQEAFSQGILNPKIYNAASM